MGVFGASRGIRTPMTANRSSLDRALGARLSLRWRRFPPCYQASSVMETRKTARAAFREGAGPVWNA